MCNRFSWAPLIFVYSTVAPRVLLLPFLAAMATQSSASPPVYIYVYWDNSNIFLGAKTVAEEQEAHINGVRFRVRIDFRKLLQLATAGRPVKRAIAGGSVPPELTLLWNRLESEGVKVTLFHRRGFGEQQVPDDRLQLLMYHDCLENLQRPGTAVLLTGDGSQGSLEEVNFRSVLAKMHECGWNVEVLSWECSCNAQLRRWATQHGSFVSLDKYYKAITFLEPLSEAPPKALSATQPEGQARGSGRGKRSLISVIKSG